MTAGRDKPSGIRRLRYKITSVMNKRGDDTMPVGRLYLLDAALLPFCRVGPHTTTPRAAELGVGTAVLGSSTFLL